jgi:hypothetical protein
MNAWLPTVAAYGLALALTLALAARLTPRAWWRRPNLRALGVTAGGTLAFGAFFALLLPAQAPAALTAAAPPPPPVEKPARVTPAAGARYRVVDDLNLRGDNGIGAARLRVLSAGTVVTATGAANGDWWRVRARVGGADVEGWASSLWLRRTDEGRGG